MPWCTSCTLGRRLLPRLLLEPAAGFLCAVCRHAGDRGAAGDRGGAGAAVVRGVHAAAGAGGRLAAGGPRWLAGGPVRAHLPGRQRTAVQVSNNDLRFANKRLDDVL